jgi:hypothetical protein
LQGEDWQPENCTQIAHSSPPQQMSDFMSRYHKEEHEKHHGAYNLNRKYFDPKEEPNMLHAPLHEECAVEWK